MSDAELDDDLAALLAEPDAIADAATARAATLETKATAAALLPVDRMSPADHVARILAAGSDHGVLDLPLQFDEAALAKQFRLLSRKVHPDKLRHVEAAADAFDRLKKAKERLKADKSIPARFEPVLETARQNLKERRAACVKAGAAAGGGADSADSDSLTAAREGMELVAECERLLAEKEAESVELQAIFERNEKFMREGAGALNAKQKKEKERARREWEKCADARAAAWHGRAAKRGRI